MHVTFILFTDAANICWLKCHIICIPHDQCFFTKRSFFVTSRTCESSKLQVKYINVCHLDITIYVVSYFKKSKNEEKEKKYNNIFIAMAMADAESKTGLITGLTLGMLAVLLIIGSALVSFRLRY